MMPGFVIDASATLPWRFEDEATPWTEALLDRVQGGEEVRVPAHWPLEVANTLLMARRSGRLTAAQVSEFIEDLAAFPIRMEQPLDLAHWPPILALAQVHRLTAYDAAYLALAKRTGLPLATLDGDLRKAAQAEGLELV
ncbi:MAG: type II toxin-antitoxin system VapC family toxin [Acidobacteria bacterium]|nr:type II toxin-antitoxin system VapC family toxin [Acidobacteriota bacterium]